ncbi:33795_t:CDS:2, partial [Gigaspora margarita]
MGKPVCFYSQGATPIEELGTLWQKFWLDEKILNLAIETGCAKELYNPLQLRTKERKCYKHIASFNNSTEARSRASVAPRAGAVPKASAAPRAIATSHTRAKQKHEQEVDNNMIVNNNENLLCSVTQ